MLQNYGNLEDTNFRAHNSQNEHEIQSYRHKPKVRASVSGPVTERGKHNKQIKHNT